MGIIIYLIGCVLAYIVFRVYLRKDNTWYDVKWNFVFGLFSWFLIVILIILWILFFLAEWINKIKIKFPKQPPHWL
jgi:hypothetical protein